MEEESVNCEPDKEKKNGWKILGRVGVDGKKRGPLGGTVFG